MNRSEFIKRMGAAALIPFVPNVVDNRPVVDLGHVVSDTTRMIDSTIILNTSDNPLNYRTVVHAYDKIQIGRPAGRMTLETVMDEYTPYDNTILEYGDFDVYRRTMTLSNLPDNYDKYELSVWRKERIIPAFTAEATAAVIQPVKVFSRTYTLRFPPADLLDLTNRITL